CWRRQREPRPRKGRRRARQQRKRMAGEGIRAWAWFPAPSSLPARGKLSVTAAAKRRPLKETAMRKAYAIVGILAAGAVIWAGGAIAQNNQNNENIGQHFQFLASNLPLPYATPASAERSTKAQDPDLGRLQLPPGFKATLFA